ncbi:MAG: SRPBCC family protein [Candidatus Eremiobacteraeota bacterium]|nr:SRPBCC family protein [Candidatus Eremiobacteraeota bacterium]
MTDNQTEIASAESALGRRIAIDAIRFERTFAAPPARLWAALTTPEGLEPWLGSATLELRTGGVYRVRLNEEVEMVGRIVTLEPPAKLVLAWHEIEGGVATAHATTDDDESELSFELQPEGNGTRLVLVHRLIRAGEAMIGFGAGWHALLEALRASLAGAPAIDVARTYASLQPSYLEAFSDEMQ